MFSDHKYTHVIKNYSEIHLSKNYSKYIFFNKLQALNPSVANLSGQYFTYEFEKIHIKLNE